MPLAAPCSEREPGAADIGRRNDTGTRVFVLQSGHPVRAGCPRPFILRGSSTQAGDRVVAKRNSSKGHRVENGSERPPAGRKARWRALDAILRQAYGEVVNEPVPDGLRAVLAQSEPKSATKA